MESTKPVKEKKPLVSGSQLVIIIISVAVSLAVFLLRPLGMSYQQSGILAATLMVIIWWSTGAVPRTWASVALVAVYVLFSGAPMRSVFTFPLSTNFVLIIVSFLFSQGISNSGLVDKLLGPVLIRFGKSPLRLMGIMLLLSFAMCFIIPQPFSRIILIGLIFANFFKKLELTEAQRSVWMLALFIISVIVNMSMIRGDIILNNALLSMAGVAVSEGTWLQYLFVPTMAYLLLALGLYWLMNRKTIASTVLAKPQPPAEKITLSGREKGYLVLILLAVVVWALEALHGIPGLYVVIAATLLMFPFGLLKLPDLKSVNLPLLVFLTAAFAIGGTLNSCGVAEVLFSAFAKIFPENFSPLYVLLIMATTILLHMLLGSNITTMSVVVPGMMTVGAGVVPEMMLVFLVLIAVCGHFLLPFHHVILLLGEGNGYYSTKQLVRFGLPLTVLVLACVFLLYMPWWNLMGI
ncbi:anion permease [Ruminococcaceae bacterium OttesenSCG-928-D13]|nr:anion permease [Ruminococcaceae bacterium OttesenSCG-928-D13]